MLPQQKTRAALTLLELVVVMAILSILAGLILLRINGVSAQANAAVDTAIIADLNKAISLYENRYQQSPNGWDGLLTGPSGTLYARLHPNVLQQSDPSLPILTPLTLNATQLQSLNQAGITFLHYNSDTGNATGRPSDSGVSFAMLASGNQVASLTVQGTGAGWTGHGSTFADRALNLNPFNVGPQSGQSRSFVVFGVGQPVSLRGATLQDSPIVQAANPTQYYARMLVVYMIPGPSEANVFPAQFVGSFCPDGSCMNDNISKFNNADRPLGTN